MRSGMVLMALTLLLALAPARAATADPGVAASPVSAAAGGLSRFPRPPADNGWGIDWPPTLFGQPTNVVDQWVEQAAGLGIKWVKIMQPDEDKIEHEQLLVSLADHGMMPVLRVFRRDNGPYEHLTSLVQAARPLGVYYYELYNEPNMAGAPGGWPDGATISVDTLVASWLPSAQQVIDAGGFPSVPALTPGGDYPDDKFLRAFLQGVIEAGGRPALENSWVALHNYFLNHPVDYPADPVNLTSIPLSQAEITQRQLSDAEVQAIDQARAFSHLPRSEGGYYVGNTIDQDSNGFLKFEAYEDIVTQTTGLVMPIISTEGGAIPGTHEDPRYPPVTDADVAERTVQAYTYMTREAPDYYFAFTPWLLANEAAGSYDPEWEAAAWFHGTTGDPKPVVAAVQRLASTAGARPTPWPTAAITPAEDAAATASGSLEPQVNGSAWADIYDPSAPSATAPVATPELTGTPMPRPGPTSTPIPAEKAAPMDASALPSPSPTLKPKLLFALAGTPTPALPPGPDPANQGWVIFWRDNAVFNCVTVFLSELQPSIRTWQPPADGHTWGMEIRDRDWQQIAAIGQPGPDASPPPQCEGVPVASALPAVPPPTPTVTATATATATLPALKVWDSRLNWLHIHLDKAQAAPGTSVWRLVSAKLEDPKQAAGRHHIYVRLLDENGQETSGDVVISWTTGQYTMTVRPRTGYDIYDYYGGNFPMYGPVGSYSAAVAGVSDKVTRFGMPGKEHVDFLLVFQRMTAPQGSDAAPQDVDLTEDVTPTPSPQTGDANADITATVAP